MQVYLLPNHLKIKKLQDTSKDSTEDEIAIIGATGTRYDHAFTNIFVLDESLEAGIRCAIYDKNNKIYLADKSFEIRKDKQFGDYLSFAPMTPEAGLSLSGVKYFTLVIFSFDNISASFFS